MYLILLLLKYPPFLLYSTQFIAKLQKVLVIKYVTDRIPEDKIIALPCKAYVSIKVHKQKDLEVQQCGQGY